MASKVSNRINTYNNINSYIDYWDLVITQWFQMNFASQELNEQYVFGQDLGYDGDSLKNRLPEPYWGDPNNCSFVMMTYNPGPCEDSRHNYRYCADADNCMIHEIKKSKYSTFAKSFPLYRNLYPLESWLDDSIGRKWWQKQKAKWIAPLLSKIGTGKLPFAMEICAWHSKHWYGINKQNYKKHNNLINGKVLEIFKDVIVNSDLKIGLCFGKRIGTELLDKNNQSIQIIKSMSNYKVYSFMNNNQAYYIVNYWDDTNTRNRFPQNDQTIPNILKNIP